MAQIGYGYGSEFQLLRFMGRHRKMLDKEILSALGESGNIDWLDFNIGTKYSNISGDKELKGLIFLKQIPFITSETYDKLVKETRKYNFNIMSKWQNWDAVFTLNEGVYLVEAKAYAQELNDGAGSHGGTSEDTHKAIKQFMSDELTQFGIEVDVNDNWLKEYYQLANRLSTAALLNNNGIKAKIVYIFFINGYSVRNVIKDGRKEHIVEDSKKSKTEDSSVEHFNQMFNMAKDNLGLKGENLYKLLSKPIYINSYMQI